jgi:succinoglycan biosynthesis protein ExoA
MTAAQVDVSVLVPVRNEARHLRQAAEAMLRQEFPGELEFIFVDGASDDDTGAILEALAAADPRVRVLDNPDRRTPQGLNIALATARGQYVARMDAHTHYPPDYLARGVERLRRGDVAHVSGPQLAKGDGTWSRRVALALGSRLGSGGAAFRRAGAEEIEVDSGFTGVWERATLRRLGGWDEGWPQNQDAELAARIRTEGGRIVCLPEMAAEYVPRDSLRALARQYWRYGMYRAKTSARHPDSMRPSHLLPPAVAICLALALAPGPLGRLARPAAGLYLAGLAAGGVLAAREDGASPGDALSVPAVLALMHTSWGLGFLAGSARFGPPLDAVARIARRPR